MKITKFVHSCLLVEMPEPIDRTLLFDPGSMSAEMLADHEFMYLDDIVITHIHPDHFSVEVIQSLLIKFPDVRILAPEDVVAELNKHGITASTKPSDDLSVFDAPHEDIEPLFPTPEQIGVHYHDTFTHPGDSHSFTETKDVLALPVQAPWGATSTAVKLALDLKPKHILPIHDWHWSGDAKDQTYGMLEQVFKEAGIKFHKLIDGEPIVLET